MAGPPFELPLSRWRAEVDAADRAMLAHCHGPALDVGCGPGRMTTALLRRGTPALGIDVSPRAVASTRARGGLAVVRDVFDPVPWEGHWRTFLLADGNIGIGGDPARLLDRARRILRPGGQVLAEVAPPEVRTRTYRLRLDVDGRLTGPFDWAVVGAAGLGELAVKAGFVLTRLDVVAGRWFARLRRGGG
ncbi:MAG: methyltransferase domain-containing protein [Propionibacteriales bacterium]|nr:methyltransferase domain-containing protein [Propionibacteriales bacterium]